MQIARDSEKLQQALLELAQAGKRVALVPTMGALHAGHMSLIRLGQEVADAVVVSIFVNPKQFGPNEDFAKYPRMLEADLRKCDEAGTAVAYAPPLEDLYPEDFSTNVSTGELSKILEGASRPGHFDGVATVVTKLLLRTLPHVAIFGEKDYQQLCVIRRVVADLDIPVEIIGAPTMREVDGLAMSSRNVYLSGEERALAPKLYETLIHVGSAIARGDLPVAKAVAAGVAQLNSLGYNVDYLELREEDTLAPIERFEGPARLLVAARLGNTRLIDNIRVE